MIGRALHVALCLPLSLASLLFAGCSGQAGALPAPSTLHAALTPEQRKRSPSPSPSPAHAETPTQADAFVNSIGVDVHLSYYGTLYGDNFALVLQRLTALGVRHVRDGIAVGQNNLCPEYAQLAAAGIHDESLTTVSNGSADLQSWATCVGSALEAFEGPNEYDINHGSDTNWAQTLSAYQSTLYQFVKGQLPGVAVVAPALTSESAYAAVGNLSGIADYGNMHDYFAGRNPGTGGWGATDSFGTYGSLAYDMAIVRQSTSTRPIMSTETGYGDLRADPNWVSPTVKMHYTLRTFLEHWNAGVARTEVYQLLDQGGSPFSSYGLLDSSGNPKPAYTALKNAIGHLADPGAPFTPTALAYTTSAPSSVHHALFQRHNDSFCLALWVEAQEWDPTLSVPIAVGPQTVVLGSFAAAPKTIAATTFDDATGNVSTKTLSLALDGTVALTVTGSVTMVDLSF